MKSRDGFVSNSSSSSFVVAGLLVSEEDMQDPSWQALVEKFEDNWGDDQLSFYSAEDGPQVLGVYVESVDRGYVQPINLEEYQERLAVAKTLIDDLGLDTTKVQLYAIGEY